MPLPNVPTRRPNNPQTRQADKKANNMLLILGLVFAFFGLGALLLPAIVHIPEMRDLLDTFSTVGWVMLALGGALIALQVWLRMRAPLKR